MMLGDTKKVKLVTVENRGDKKLIVVIFLGIKMLRYTKRLHKNLGHMFK